MPDSSPWPLKGTYRYHLGWGVLGGFPDGSSSLHDDETDDDDDDDDGGGGGGGGGGGP